MLVIYLHEFTTIQPPKIQKEDLYDMQLKITQKMNSFIYLSNKEDKYFKKIKYKINCRDS